MADPAIFSLIQSSGDIADEEMVRTFNVGIGLTAVVPAAHADAALAASAMDTDRARQSDSRGRAARPIRMRPASP